MLALLAYQELQFLSCIVAMDNTGQFLRLFFDDKNVAVATLLWTILARIFGGIFVICKWVVERNDARKRIKSNTKSSLSVLSLTIDEYELRLRERTAEVVAQYQSVEGEKRSFSIINL